MYFNTSGAPLFNSLFSSQDDQNRIRTIVRNHPIPSTYIARCISHNITTEHTILAIVDTGWRVQNGATALQLETTYRHLGSDVGHHLQLDTVNGPGSHQYCLPVSATWHEYIPVTPVPSVNMLLTPCCSTNINSLVSPLHCRWRQHCGATQTSHSPNDIFLHLNVAHLTLTCPELISIVLIYIGIT